MKIDEDVSKEHSAHIEHAEETTVPTKDALQASTDEHEATVWEALRHNYKAVLWSAAISLSIIMEGYDVALIYQFFTYPAFQEKFGSYRPEQGDYIVSGPWQAGLSNGANVGIVIGGFMNGYLSTRFGYKRVLLAALFFMNWFIFILFFAPSAPVLLVGQILCGLTWGVFATSSPAYASEVCPLALRGYLTCYVNLCWAMGQFIASGALYGLLKIESEWSYRIAYALQWIWPVPLFVLIMFAPESPWWLARNNRMGDAYKSLARLDTRGHEAHQRTLAQIMHTLELESKLESRSSYLDCFRGIDRRRTEVVCMSFAGQVLSGSAFAYTPTYFFVQAGISTENAYQITVGGTAISFVGTIISWFLLTRFGRRQLYVTGVACLTGFLLIIGITAAASESSSAKWGQAAMCLVWLFTYSVTLGPVTYTIISETFSVHLRAKSVCLSRNVYNITNIVAQVVEPYLINPTEANLKGKTAFVWAATAAVTTVWAFFRLPECRGRTYDELDVMFHRKLPARKFATYQVNAHDADALKTSPAECVVDNSGDKA
ncbi:putative transporter [Aspergillus oryzae 3.042]|uniref:Putative transporter n=1 Tax=Aspergillus oryzae (strain 3.042) TaxID=1160506 RepID=I8TK33_ASPO3|nr:putative transporter [Aspergillus oryzae 3.042]|eukprot:EIT74098.1 putative transporter [Aspergillus oryzae 3.042]